MYRDEILENENRRKIYRVISSNPGIHLRELQRVLDMPLSTVDYHLGYMVKKEIILRDQNKGIIRYFAKPFDEAEKRIVSALRQKRMRDIVFIVLRQRKTRFKLLIDQLQLPRSTLAFYLKYLVEHGILIRERVGTEHIYRLIDEERVAKILITYRTSFIDKVVDKVMNTWLDTHIRTN
ncbi:MAG: winged helix-turn-helix transcriptional regulator [Candidatus Bathyarchaeota archaeon]|jgi:predicted transcriptional regulator|nr:winged helix-turn-helix transcriptional regulator [Candidatus Bathyarchaeota archaeon]